MGSTARELHTVASYFRVVKLARGGMGEVSLALRTGGEFRRLYALKSLRPQLRDDEVLRKMFLEEARIAGLIRHPNVVSVLDVGEDDLGPFLVMEYIEGVSALKLFKKLESLAHPLPLQIALRIVADAARGLHAAHELRDPDGTAHPVVHRDVSPQNILLGYDGMTRLTDFGVAKALGSMEKTDSGVLKGKIAYMSPEQLRFEPLDFRSDLFSLGVVLYELLLNERLYGPDNEEPAPQRILREPPPDLGERRLDLPPALVELSFELLDKDPAVRPSSAREVADRLDAIRIPVEAEQGSLHLADYLDTLFEGEKSAQQRAIAEALKTSTRSPARSGADASSPEDAFTAVDVETPTMAPATTTLKPGLRRWWLAAVLVFALVSGALVTVWLLSGSAATRDTTVSPPTTTTPSSTLIGAEDIIPAAPEAMTETRAGDDAVSPVQVVNTAAEHPEDSTEPVKSKRRRTTHGNRRPARHSTTNPRGRTRDDSTAPTSAKAGLTGEQTTPRPSEETTRKQYRLRDDY